MLKGSRAGEVNKDIVGKKYGSLTVMDDFIRVYTKYGTKIKFLCRCDCGCEAYYYRDSLQRRKVKYCKKCRPIGIRHSKLYHIYHGIKQRCYNPNIPWYEIYGGKGVKMCKEWLDSFDAFRDWSLSNGYKEGLSIDRLNSDGDYCPENCEWVTLSVNSARSNFGRQQIFTKLLDVYAILPDGSKCPITNIRKFAEEHSLIASSVYAALHGRINPLYHGYYFHSNKSRQESVTTIETTPGEKSSARKGVE